ncbi:Nif3-like dinuclear metal center hexameric protein [Brackiella oedipodis]|uniref:Nif3-like dinuclear metal center hexameric protein n=1 Tax=Brackiella oedipodis TaxID=124225 RepID=UPI0004904B44|nr:Nif3-like dinuclear metal center hexameric protein [Brackiella oedipodis]
MSQVNIADITTWLEQQLQPDNFRDYAPNGLQVQGKPTIKKIVLGVTASLALVQAAIKKQADAIIVHHGWFWKNEDSRIIGWKYNRIASLIKHDINLIGYHLPLDAHPEWGNNACLAKVLDLQPMLVAGKPQTVGAADLIWLGQPKEGAITVAQMTQTIAKRLQRQPIVIGEPQQTLHKIAWCTGGAQGMFEEAIQAGADAYITGEASEQVCHLARENGVAYFEAGHHATERYGIQALGQALQQHFPDLDIEYLEIANPI